VSFCCFCFNAAETSEHLFLVCPEIWNIWSWLSDGIHFQLDLSSAQALLVSGQSRRSGYVQMLMISAKLHCFWCIWVEQNNQKFQSKASSIQSIICKITAEVHLSSNILVGHGSHSMADYRVTQLFHCPSRLSQPLSFIAVSWFPPHNAQIKANIDGSSFGLPPSTFIGGDSQNQGRSQILNIGGTKS